MLRINPRKADVGPPASVTHFLPNKDKAKEARQGDRPSPRSLVWLALASCSYLALISIEEKPSMISSGTQ